MRNVFRKPLKRAVRQNLAGWSMLSLWTLGFLVFTFYPLLTSFRYSLSRVILSGQGIQVLFVGLDNYRAVFSTAAGFTFLMALRDFAVEVLIKVPIVTVFAIIIAVLLNQKIRFRGFFRAIYFLPVIIASGPVITQLVNQGAATVPLVERMGILGLIEGMFAPWLAGPIASVFGQLIVILWFSGVQILLFIAALQKIDRSVYEAAMIDGAGPWESFWKITMPALKNMVLVSVIFTIINLATFSENPAIVQIKDNMFALDTGFGFSSAIAWIYALVLALLLGVSVLVLNVFGKRRARP